MLNDGTLALFEKLSDGSSISRGVEEISLLQYTLSFTFFRF